MHLTLNNMPGVEPNILSLMTALWGVFSDGLHLTDGKTEPVRQMKWFTQSHTSNKQQKKNLIIHSEAPEPTFLTIMWFRCSFENSRRHLQSLLSDPSWRPEDCHGMNEIPCTEKSHSAWYAQQMLFTRIVNVFDYHPH